MYGSFSSMAAASMRIEPMNSSRFSSAASFSRSMYSSMSPAMLLKFSASSLISAAPRTGERWWNSPRLMARVEAARPRIGALMPTAKK